MARKKFLLDNELKKNYSDDFYATDEECEDIDSDVYPNFLKYVNRRRERLQVTLLIFV